MQAVGTSAVVLGGSGFGGGEVLRLLAGHPGIEIVAVAGDSRAGRAVASVHPHLRGAVELEVVTAAEALKSGADVCFACLPSGALPELLARSQAPFGLVVDLADDFRTAQGEGWVYGLPEFARADVHGAARVANPGCYPTAVLLALVPFARAGLIGGPVVVDALSGVSGAGRAARDDLLLAGAEGNVAAYGTTHHRHVPEMERGLAAFGGLSTTISFTPHLVPMARGLLVTARAPVADDATDDDVLAVLAQAYATEPFVDVVEGWPATRPVAGTNRVHVSARVDARNGLLITSASIDNLGKGAAGQAVQNANVALGLDETTGLALWSPWP